MLYLKRETNFFRDNLRVLHFAPEKFSRTTFAKLPNLKYTSTDYCAPAHMNSDITRLPFADATFDVILSMHVLEHIPDDRAAMRELRRVLRPGGWAILQVPIDMSRSTTYEDWSITDPVERRKHFGQEDHVRMYGRDYGDRLAEAGFTVSVVPYPKILGTGPAQKYGLMWDEDLYYCQRGPA